MINLTKTDADTFAADCRAAGLTAKVGKTGDDRLVVAVRIENKATGNSANYTTAHADGALPDAVALSAKLRAELAGRASATRSAIRAEKSRS